MEIAGAALIFPLAYTMNDIITEVYGLSVSRHTIWIGLLAEGFFDVVCGTIVRLPSSDALYATHPYFHVLGGLPWVFVSDVVAIAVGLLVNSLILSRLKRAVNGRWFRLRSIIST